ncbi:hypothetical protein P3X46_021718 [Hevea brasiliensis]|uniref:Late embryogenesis abundant protein LEA-2 subgroup domain-containing protein n=1 Tax=Hevea brasiliensis TaxID=3981 RepID=A0ABQ9LGI4_HEVBR|nr:NDR1/HIN1-like protein 13 [Hevea brasiliensis]KAJ9167036.1 hypothetical protein P3X46_021718 [Hevea brasiliensis]
MAERLSPLPSSNVHIHDPVTAQSRPAFQSGTYVVQVPKDQIYRVPPPENALIVERRRNPESKKLGHRCSAQLFCFILIAFVVIATTLAIGFSFSLLKAKNPEFQVQRLVVSSSSHSNPDYNVMLKVHNPNGKSGILYVQGGVASLFFEEQIMAAGKFPIFNQDENNSTEIGIALKGSKIMLPNNIKKSMKSTKPKVNLSFSLKMNVPARMKTNSFKIGDTKLVIICEFKVDTLAKGTQILSQQCETIR